MMRLGSLKGQQSLDWKTSLGRGNWRELQIQKLKHFVNVSLKRFRILLINRMLIITCASICGRRDFPRNMRLDLATLRLVVLPCLIVRLLLNSHTKKILRHNVRHILHHSKLRLVVFLQKHLLLESRLLKLKI